MNIEENILLAPFTTFRLGGPARFFVRVRSTEELKEALAFAAEHSLRVFILGGGSNVLFPDEGFGGLVLRIELMGIEQKGGTYIAAGGESWDGLVERAVRDGMWGIENLSGIPGTVGGAVAQNIGAYGAALSQTLSWAEVYDMKDGSVRVLSREELKLGYRHSVLKEEPGRYVVLRAAVEVSPAPKRNLSYRDLAQRFPEGDQSLEDIRAAVCDIRAGKFPDLSKEGSAGSYFKNPTVTSEEAGALAQRFEGLPLFEMPETALIKVPLGWILDRVLDLRGYRLGEVRLFEKQALVIAASSNASAEHVRALAEKIKSLVKEKIGIEIEEEVCVVHA